MRATWIGGVVIGLAVMAGAARGDAKKKATKAPALPKTFWKVLVKPNAKWVLESENKSETITVETYDVRKVGDADVARLRWSYRVSGGAPEDIGATDAGKYTQVAVTDKGLYLLNATNDDARIAQRLKGAPSRSTPPKPYDGNRKNGGRYLVVNPQGTVCMGEAPNTEQFCEDTCDGWVCISPTDGIVELAGTYAPSFEMFSQK